MKWLARLLNSEAAPRSAASTGVVAGAPAAAAAPTTPTTAAEHLRKGNALLEQGRLAEAAQQYRECIRADALHAGAHVNLAFTLIESGQPGEALAPLRRAVALAPASHDAHYLLGMALQAQLALAPAIEHLEKAIALKPDLLVAYRDLGKALHVIGQHDRAKAILRAGIEVDPRSADLHYFVGNIELHQMMLDEALASYRRALAIQPDYAAVHSNMAQALLDLCDFEGATAAARRALAIDPSLHFARSNLLMTLSSDAKHSPEEYLAEARLYGTMLMAGTAPRVAASSEAREASTTGTTRRLRVGFVSGDLRNHPVGYFLESVLAHWDNALGMEAIAYSNHPAHDDLTARLKERFGAWRDIWGMSNDAAARQIESDRIDVLVDLSGHTAENRLPLFARRPARVQASWLGYWASTGLPTMDYLLADRVSVPPEQRVQFTETIWYLPETRMCFSPPAGPGVPEVSRPPSVNAGHVTFGSFQRQVKLNDSVLALWARVMQAVPGSRLRLQSAQMKTATARIQLLQRLAAAGIDSARVQLAVPGPRIEYLAAHAEVDIILDTFPHGGATTTCEALWMGVPTLTLAGKTMLARQGASLLACAGLAEWIAADQDDYVARAVRLAGDPAALARLRRGLREQVAASPLFDAARFTVNLQSALRGMWHAQP